MLRRFLGVAASSLAGGLAWLAGMLVVFGPAQSVLSNPDMQSAKFLAVFNSMAPLPRTSEQPILLFVALIGIACLYTLVFRVIKISLPKPILQCSFKFGVILWAIMVPWFEFYLPWNVMHEPAWLVAVELLCWFGVLQLVALAIVTTQEWSKPAT